MHGMGTVRSWLLEQGLWGVGRGGGGGGREVGDAVPDPRLKPPYQSGHVSAQSAFETQQVHLTRGLSAAGAPAELCPGMEKLSRLRLPARGLICLQDHLPSDRPESGLFECPGEATSPGFC